MGRIIHINLQETNIYGLNHKTCKLSISDSQSIPLVYVYPFRRFGSTLKDFGKLPNLQILFCSCCLYLQKQNCLIHHSPLVSTLTIISATSLKAIEL
jgi:hypothetical protein